MTRRLPHIAFSLWLAITSLIPGRGWMLCVSPNGHVAVEAVASVPALPSAESPACAEDCGEERCESCHDVRLTSAERACSRRDVVAVELDVAPAHLVSSIEPPSRTSIEPPPPAPKHPDAALEFLRVLRI